MNKLIMGLSCLGVLSAVSCDNDSNKPDNTDKYQFTLKLQKSDGETLFNSTTDKDAVIHLTVKDGDKEVYDRANLFGKDAEGKDIAVDSLEKFKITLPSELKHYSNDGNNLTIVGTVTPKDGKAHNFTIESGTVKEGPVVLKVVNVSPVITNELASDKKIDLSKDELTIFTVNDEDGDKIDWTCEFELYDDRVNGLVKKLSHTVHKVTGAIKPSAITLADGTTKLSTKSADELNHYTITATAKADDKLTGKTGKTILKIAITAGALGAGIPPPSGEDTSGSGESDGGGNH